MVDGIQTLQKQTNKTLEKSSWYTMYNIDTPTPLFKLQYADPWSGHDLFS